MKITAISDTHLAVPFLEGGDLLIHAGDLTSRGSRSEVESQLKWIAEQDYRHKVFVPGNHDFLFEKEPAVGRDLCKQYGITLLMNEFVDIEGLKIWGSPVTPYFFNWAFNAFDDELKRTWKAIPSGIDILVTHGPPYGVMDLTLRGPRAGCRFLREKVLEIKPRVHIFGHIHEGYGQKLEDDIFYINASLMTVRYEPENPAFDFELEV